MWALPMAALIGFFQFGGVEASIVGRRDPRLAAAIHVCMRRSRFGEGDRW